jgi:hypothetical protein
MLILNLSAESKLKFQIEEVFISRKFLNVFSGLEIEINTSTYFEMQAWEYRVYAN